MWANKETYLSSYVRFDSRDGWTENVASVPRHLVPSGGAHDPEDCNYVRWSECGTGIREAATYCKGCDGLECDGCVYRELPENVDDHAFTDCCPCNYYYAQRYHVPWMAVDC
jgi:hypothetical protein